MERPTIYEIEKKYPEGCTVKDWNGDVGIVQHYKIQVYTDTLIRMLDDEGDSIHLWNSGTWATIIKYPEPEFNPFF